MRALALSLGLALGALAGCGDERGESAGESAAEKGPPPISETEAERGRKACRAYRDKVCAKAEGDPGLEEECRLAGTRIEALEMQLEALEGARGGPEQRRVIQENVRRIIKHCFEENSGPSR